jgi:hypothetical protein
MKLYRFSPISSHETLLEAITHIHNECYKLCFQATWKYLPNAGNVWVFCHYDEEHEFLTKLRKELTIDSDNIHQKYFRLHQPIVIPANQNHPEGTYTYLYIRKPDPYRFHVWDVDFYLSSKEYDALKERLLSWKYLPGARIFDRKDLDMIELYNPDNDVLWYISTEMMTETVRAKQIMV